MKHPPGLGPLVFFALRRLESWLPLRGFYWCLRPFAWASAAWQRTRPSAPWPAGLGPAPSATAIRRQRINFQLNRVVEFFPERLAAARWKARCRISGLDRLQRARQAGRPLVLAFCHSGPFFLLRPWLRAAGIPVTILVGRTAGSRSRVKRLKDRRAPFPEVPCALYQDQLREVIQLLARGQALLIAVDHPTGRQVDVPVGEGWNFRMATGAVRLAARSGAELIPCAIIDEGGWRFRIELGPPVPREYLTEAADPGRAGEHLLAALLTPARASPEQCAQELIACFR